MAAHERDEGAEQVALLVKRFAENLDYYRSPDFDELSTRDHFINPLMEALGWDVTDKAGLGPQREVILEHRLGPKVEMGGELSWDTDLSEDELLERQKLFRKYPDYAFRVGGDIQFFVEAKRPGIAVSGRVPVFQLKTYAWTSELSVSAVTDFEEFLVFDCTLRPDFDSPGEGLLLRVGFEEYEDRWDELWGLLSREAVTGGRLRRIRPARARGGIRVDVAFLDDLTTWRKDLAQGLIDRNRDLDSYQLAEATQRILDRLVFIRVCEDRLIEADLLLRRYARLSDSYRRLIKEFRRLDVVYNGQLFAEHFSERLEITDGVFHRLVEHLYPPRSPYRFDVLGVDVLGAIYERFLGKTINVDDNGYVQLEDKPEVRHAGGVYYTPTWVVDYLVEATIGPALEGMSPRAAANIRVLDPACGSGSFLLGGLDYMIRWHETYYTAQPDEDTERHFLAPDGSRRLTSDAKGEILRRCIFGVDIDPQAVEVTQMSLYLKVLEGEEGTTLRDRRLFHGALLPPLAENIRSGNSLLGTDDVPLQLLDTFDVQRRVNPFDWDDIQHGFEDVLSSRGGFDAIIGNPPYTRIQVLRQTRPQEAAAYAAKYATASEGSFDIAGLFVERCVPLLRSRSDARLGFIISRQFAEADYGRPLRGLLSTKRHVERIVDFGAGTVFEGVGAYTLLLLLNSRRQNSYRLTRVDPPPSAERLRDAEADERASALMEARTLSGEPWDLLLPRELDLLAHLATGNRTLGEVTSGRVFQGVVTGADNTVFRFVDRGPDPENGRLRKVVSRGDPEGPLISLETDLLRKVFEGRTAISRFVARDSHNLLLLPYLRGNPEGRYELIPPDTLRGEFPHAARWLDDHRDLLQARSGLWTDDNWYAYSARKNLELFEGDKILVPYMVDHLCAHWDTDRYFFVNVSTGGYGLVPSEGSDPLLLTALLNSRILSWVLRCYSRAWRGGWFAARKGNLVRLPIIERDSIAASQIVTLFGRCVDAQQVLDAAVSESQIEIARRRLDATVEDFDAAVEAAYAITPTHQETLDLASTRSR